MSAVNGKTAWSAVGNCRTSVPLPGAVESVWHMHESIDHEALVEADIDPADADEWEAQCRVSDYLQCYGMWLRGWHSQ